MIEADEGMEVVIDGIEEYITPEFIYPVLSDLVILYMPFFLSRFAPIDVKIHLIRDKSRDEPKPSDLFYYRYWPSGEVPIGNFVEQSGNFRLNKGDKLVFSNDPFYGNIQVDTAAFGYLLS